MTGVTKLADLVKNMSPRLNDGEYVFVTVKDISSIDRADTLGEFKEAEGTTVVMEKKKADEYKLSYEYVASWITLMVHSSLEAVGLTALFSAELARHQISCNVVAGYFHDHIFVDQKDGEKVVQILNALAKRGG
ncbi:ACT domain-containing protein [Catalinimonas locisalis]|uniref:ACT domain-containing protein n=1 Tax=Catalinimonas locisalis TaxID=3133978 RepID=UPI0031015B68